MTLDKSLTLKSAKTTRFTPQNSHILVILVYLYINLYSPDGSKIYIHTVYRPIRDTQAHSIVHLFVLILVYLVRQH